MRFLNRWSGVALLLWTFSAPAADELFAHPSGLPELAGLLAPAQKELATSAVLRGSFTQKKFLAGIPRPLVSEGEYIFARDQGVYWHSLKPFDSEFVLTRAGILQHDAGGTPIRLSAEQQPALRIVADIFLSLFELDLKLLADNFETYGRSSGAGWILGLQAKPGALGGVMQRVRVEGVTQVQHIEFLDNHGDRTELSLVSDGHGREPLTPAEISLFKLN
jgi:hypothetical protein